MGADLRPMMRATPEVSETSDGGQHDLLRQHSNRAATDSPKEIAYQFGPFRIYPAERLLLRDGNPIPVTAQAFDTLLVLVQHNGHLVERSELIRTVWADSFVEEGNLTVVICTLR